MDTANEISALVTGGLGLIGTVLGIRAERRAQAAERQRGAVNMSTLITALEPFLAECQAQLTFTPAELAAGGFAPARSALNALVDRCPAVVKEVQPAVPHLAAPLWDLQRTASRLLRHDTLDLREPTQFVWAARQWFTLYSRLSNVAYIRAIAYRVLDRHHPIEVYLSDTFHGRFRELAMLASEQGNWALAQLPDETQRAARAWRDAESPPAR